MAQATEPQIDQDDQHNMKLVFVGDTAVGKTSIIITWTQDRFPNLYEPTVFDTYKGVKDYKGSEVKLQIWDTAGHEDLGRLRPIAYANTDCFIICFDLMQPNSLENACKTWVAEVKSCAKSCPCILVGTKLDLREELEREVERTGETHRLQNVVSTEQIVQAAKKYAFQGYVQCSAKEKKGLNDVFKTAFKVVFQLRSMNEPGKNAGAAAGAGAAKSFDLSGPNPPPASMKTKNKSGCCK